jgi:hypothetical protein
MRDSDRFEPERAVDLWVNYLEKFPYSDVTVQTLLSFGYNYPELISLFEDSMRSNEPITLQQLTKRPKG